MAGSGRPAAICGIGQTEFSKDSGRSELQLALEACRAALADAGLAPSDIDGMVTFTNDPSDEFSLIRYLGIPELRWISRTPHGGGLSMATVQHAVAAVASGAARHVLVWRAFNERSGRRFGQPMQIPNTPPGSWYRTYGLQTPAQVYSLWFQRYMVRYGLTNADLGRYVVVARQHAATNPNAWYYKRPITLEEHQESRWIVEPILRRLDCCQESDGGVALIVTSGERAADLASQPVAVEAAVQAHLAGGDIMYDYYHEDLTEFSEAKAAARQLKEVTGLDPADYQVALLYENFSPIVLMQLEAFGFCGRGEARDFIADGHIGLHGTIPVNTHGGLLGEAYIHGVNNLLEGVRQVRGTAANQIHDVQHVLCASGRSAVVLGRA